MDKDTESGIFVKEVAKYFMNFLETDFKKRRIPKRDTNKKTKSELTVGLDFEKYPKFKELLIKNLNTGFNKSELSAKRGDFVIDIPDNISKFIDIRIIEINEVTLNEFVSAILKVFADNKVLYNQQGSKPVTVYIDEVTLILLCKYLFIEYDNYIEIQILSKNSRNRLS